MSRRYYMETFPDGRQQFVTLKRSKTFHHHRHSCDYYKVSREEWNSLVDRNRALEKANHAFGAQNDSLRANLSAAQAEIQRISCLIPQLEGQIASLQAENHSLRCALESGGGGGRIHRDTERLRMKVCKLEKENKEIKDENADLRHRVRELSKQLDQSFSRRVSELTKEVEYWKGMCNFWKHKYEELREQHVKILSIYDAKTEKLARFEDIIKRHRIIDPCMYD